MSELSESMCCFRPQSEIQAYSQQVARPGRSMAVIPRRRFVIAAGALLVSPVAGNAQRGERVYRVGTLSSNLAPSPNAVFMVDRLRELGWIEQRNLVFEHRYTGGDRQKIATAARDLVALRVDLIITGGGAETPQAAMEATESIPIVFLIADDPVRLGLVRSLARPGRNGTGDRKSVV